MTHRVIARLDIKGHNLVKGIHLEGLRVLGAPEGFAVDYYQLGADELIYQDVVASLYDRNSLKEMISKTAESVFIPLTVGGGLRSIEDINEVLRAGADKVALNTAAIKNPGLIREAVKRFGASTIVVAIEATREADGRYLAYTDNGREYTGKEVLSWAREVEALGAGEILLTSIDKDGTGEGYDLELIKMVSAEVSIPVVAHGGCKGPQDAVDAIKKAGASAVAIASGFHYDELGKGRGLYEAGHEGNTEFLKKGVAFSKIAPFSLEQVKESISTQGLPCRILPGKARVVDFRLPSTCRVGIVDFGLGNLFSIRNAFNAFKGCEAFISQDPDELSGGDCLVLPGVGAFPEAMENLKKAGLVEFLKAWALKKKPLLGICLGLQLLFEFSEEFGHSPGLGILKGGVKRFPKVDAMGKKMLVPRIGWSRLSPGAPGRFEGTALEGLSGEDHLYFVHSFVVHPEEETDVLTVSQHQGLSYCSAIQKGSVTAFQFHPEKSGPVGLSVLRRWLVQNSPHSRKKA